MLILIGTDILSFSLRTKKHKIDLPAWGNPFHCFLTKARELWLSGIVSSGFFIARISLPGIRQYRQQAESCRDLLQPAGQEMATSKILFRPLTSVRRYGVGREMTIFLPVGKGRPWQLFQTLALNVRLAVKQYTDFIMSPSQGAIMPTVHQCPIW